MPIQDLLYAGVKTMIIGMGIVFAFLIMLVLAMLLMSRIAKAIAPDKSQEVSIPQTVPAEAPPAELEDQVLVAVISAAIRQFRTQHPH